MGMTIRKICSENGGQCATAKYLGVSDRTVRKWVAENWMPRYMLERLGYTYRIVQLDAAVD